MKACRGRLSRDVAQQPHQRSGMDPDAQLAR